jgi:ParB family chromosome partitioning protein
MSSDDNSHGLGKSLARVFARTQRKEPEGGNGTLDVDITRIIPPRDNPRHHFDETALQDLAESIRQHGILQPLSVCRREGRFEIIAGERRFRAARLAGLTSVPIVIREEPDARELAELQLIENLQREDLGPIELAQAFARLLEDHALTQEELARAVGKDRSTVANSLRLLALPPELQGEVAAGRLSTGHAKVLLGLPDAAAQVDLGRRAVAEALSVRALEDLVRRHGRRTRGKARPQPPNIKELEANLYKLFGAPVKVREQAGRGSITVSFTSKDSFKHIVAVLQQAIGDARRTGA